MVSHLGTHTHSISIRPNSYELLALAFFSPAVVVVVVVSPAHNFLRSRTKTLPSLALAPTLLPLEFQQTSKMPPVPL